jgi:hypothetical protein
MLSVKFYRNLRRNLFYGIYLIKFHTICKEKFQKCDHRIGNTVTFCTDIPFCGAFQLRGKKILHLREELKHMSIVRIFFWLPFCLKHILTTTCMCRPYIDTNNPHIGSTHASCC